MLDTSLCCSTLLLGQLSRASPRTISVPSSEPIYTSRIRPSLYRHSGAPPPSVLPSRRIGGANRITLSTGRYVIVIPGHRSIPSCADTAVLYHNPWLIRMRESTSNPHEMVSTCKTIWQSPASLFLSANISRPELACEWMESTHRCAPTLKSEFVSPTVTLSVSVQRTPLPLNAVLCASSYGLVEHIAVTFLSEMVPQLQKPCTSRSQVRR